MFTVAPSGASQPQVLARPLSLRTASTCRLCSGLSKAPPDVPAIMYRWLGYDALFADAKKRSHRTKFSAQCHQLAMVSRRWRDIAYFTAGTSLWSYAPKPSILPPCTSFTAAARSWGRSAGIHSGAVIRGTSLPSTTPTLVPSRTPGNAPNRWLNERFSSITYTTCLTGHRVSTVSGGTRRSPFDSSSLTPNPPAPATATAPPAHAARRRNVRRETRLDAMTLEGTNPSVRST